MVIHLRLPANFLANTITEGIPETPTAQITAAGVSTITPGSNS